MKGMKKEKKKTPIHISIIPIYPELPCSMPPLICSTGNTRHKKIRDHKAITHNQLKIVKKTPRREKKDKKDKEEEEKGKKKK